VDVPARRKISVKHMTLLWPWLRRHDLQNLISLYLTQPNVYLLPQLLVHHQMSEPVLSGVGRGRRQGANCPPHFSYFLWMHICAAKLTKLIYTSYMHFMAFCAQKCVCGRTLQGSFHRSPSPTGWWRGGVANPSKKRGPALRLSAGLNPPLQLGISGYTYVCLFSAVAG